VANENSSIQLNHSVLPNSNIFKNVTVLGCH
jgi:hypothetical protein